MLALIAPVLIPLIVAMAIVWGVGLIFNNCTRKRN